MNATLGIFSVQQSISESRPSGEGGPVEVVAWRHVVSRWPCSTLLSRPKQQRRPLSLSAGTAGSAARSSAASAMHDALAATCPCSVLNANRCSSPRSRIRAHPPSCSPTQPHAGGHAPRPHHPAPAAEGGGGGDRKPPRLALDREAHARGGEGGCGSLTSNGSLGTSIRIFQSLSTDVLVRVPKERSWPPGAGAVQAAAAGGGLGRRAHRDHPPAPRHGRGGPAGLLLRRGGGGHPHAHCHRWVASDSCTARLSDRQ